MFGGRACEPNNTWRGVNVEISMNPNDQYRLWTFVFLIRLTEQSVNHHLREFNIPQKNTNELGPA